MSNNITISDVAEALGVSKTTVSRAISGKGRIGAATRKRVLEYIQEHDYKPNVIARGLAQSKTFNICVVMPGDYADVYKRQENTHLLILLLHLRSYIRTAIHMLLKPCLLYTSRCV